MGGVQRQWFGQINSILGESVDNGHKIGPSRSGPADNDVHRGSVRGDRNNSRPCLLVAG
jgi:hypothetical protein